jgi:S1-C subfamily serine protease
MSAAGVLVLASAATGGLATARILSLESPSVGSSQSAPATPQQGTSGGPSRAGVTTAAVPATKTQSVGVVLIDTVLKYQGAEAAGTGLILTSNGEILTNNHVVDGATSITVTVASTGKSYTASVVGTDPTKDVAVLQLSGASGLSTAPTTSSSNAAVADAVTAVGNANGTGSLSQASGSITAVNQSITASGDNGSNPEALTGLIQTNADIVPGDSGGPLYDSAGDVIGIDTAASSGSTTVTGFAIPITTALGIAHQIEAGTGTAGITLGYPAFLGVEVQPDGTAIGAAQGPSTGIAPPAGAVIAGSLAGTPAETLGLAAGDIITAVDGTAITSSTQLSSVLGGYNPGDTVTIGWTDAAGVAHSGSATLIAGAAN